MSLYLEWGSVQGDEDADSIIRRRREDKKDNRTARILTALPFVPCLIWYGATGSHWALSAVIFAFAGIIHMAIEDGTYSNATMVQIAETRARVIEGQIQLLQKDVDDVRSKVDLIGKALPYRRGSDWD